jgi:hypothetical protein
MALGYQSAAVQTQTTESIDFNVITANQARWFAIMESIDLNVYPIRESEKYEKKD